MPKVLIVTNDFPPRSGGIQSFVHSLASGMPPDGVVVYAPAWPGAAEFDAQQAFPVVRHPTSLMLPVPGVARRARAILAEHGCDTVLFGAAAPLGLLAPGLRAAGAKRIIALTHGHEAGWAALPGARALLRKIGEHADVVTYLGEYFRIRLARAFSPAAAARMARLAPGVDNQAFHPGAGGAAIRARLGIHPEAPVVVCVSRLVRRKGQDSLIRVWPRVLRSMQPAEAGRPALCLPVPEEPASGRSVLGRSVPGEPVPGRSVPGEPVLGESVLGEPVLGESVLGEPVPGRSVPGEPVPGESTAGRPAPVLLIVGGGPDEKRLHRLARRTGVAESVVFAGSVPWAELPACYDAGNVFAMPCRTRRAGLDVEGLGIVYLEASATGLPVIGGDSGGAPDAILPGETGYVAKKGDLAGLSDLIVELLRDADAAATMGDKGAAWIDQEWRWDLVSGRLAEIIAGSS
jgi:phosphatidylinositol alpha-1,6-mannosyltransferase